MTGIDVLVVAAFLFLLAGALALGGWIGRRQERAAQKRADQRRTWMARIDAGIAKSSPTLPNIGGRP